MESLEDPDENRLSGTTHLTFTTGGSVAYHPQHSHYSSGGALHGDSSVNLYRASIGGGQYQMVNKSNLHQMVSVANCKRSVWHLSIFDFNVTSFHIAVETII